MTLRRLLPAAGCFLATAAVSPAVVYSIDIDSTRTGGTTTTGGSVFTEPGWTSLDVTEPDVSNGASVIVDGIQFSIFSADSSRLRLLDGSANPNPLTGDFVFDDGAGQAVGLTFGVAGSLPAGDWQVEIWAWDSGVPNFETQTMLAGSREDGAESPLVPTVPHPTNPAATFVFTSNGASAYDVFVREDSDGNRTRLNAVRLTSLPVPEPGTALLALAGLTWLPLRRRR